MRELDKCEVCKEEPKKYDYGFEYKNINHKLEICFRCAMLLMEQNATKFRSLCPLEVNEKIKRR